MKNYIKGERILTIDQMMAYRWVFIGYCDKPVPRAWYGNWQVWYAQKVIRDYGVYLPVKKEKEETK